MIYEVCNKNYHKTYRKRINEAINIQWELTSESFTVFKPKDWVHSASLPSIQNRFVQRSTGNGCNEPLEQHQIPESLLKEGLETSTYRCVVFNLSSRSSPCSWLFGSDRTRLHCRLTGSASLLAPPLWPPLKEGKRWIKLENSNKILSYVRAAFLLSAPLTLSLLLNQHFPKLNRNLFRWNECLPTDFTPTLLHSTHQQKKQTFRFTPNEHWSSLFGVLEIIVFHFKQVENVLFNNFRLILC